jgi:hypothetical protein
MNTSIVDMDDLLTKGRSSRVDTADVRVFIDALQNPIDGKCLVGCLLVILPCITTEAKIITLSGLRPSLSLQSEAPVDVLDLRLSQCTCESDSTFDKLHRLTNSVVVSDPPCGLHGSLAAVVAQLKLVFKDAMSGIRVIKFAKGRHTKQWTTSPQHLMPYGQNIQIFCF